MMARLKTRAEQNGGRVAVNNGVLSVDNIEVFSLKDGKINHDG